MMFNSSDTQFAGTNYPDNCGELVNYVLTSVARFPLSVGLHPFDTVGIDCRQDYYNRPTSDKLFSHSFAPQENIYSDGRTLSLL